MSNSRPIILVDGVCNLCNGFVKFLSSKGGADNFDFLSLQSSDAKALLKKHEYRGQNLDSVVLIENDKLWTESSAVLRILARLKGPVRILSIGRVIPSSLRDLVYRWIARNRYAWFGASESCEFYPKK